MKVEIQSIDEIKDIGTVKTVRKTSLSLHDGSPAAIIEFNDSEDQVWTTYDVADQIEAQE